VVSVAADRHAIVVRRDDVPGMSTGVTLRLAVADPALVDGVEPNATVTFEYTRRAFAQPALVSLRREEAKTVLMHDHTPHHGGVVAMVGGRHLEARADASGRLEVYVTDFYRRPLAVDGARGTVTIAGADIVPLAPEGEALVGRANPIAAPRIDAKVAIALGGGETIAMDFALPIAPGAGGAAAVAQSACVPLEPTGASQPRCLITFSQPVSALAASSDGTTLLVAVAGAGVSVWRLPEGTLTGALDPAPPITVPPGETPHPEIVSRIVWRPDGTEALVVLEGRLLRYALPGGKLVRVLSGANDVVRDAAWWPGGRRIVVTAFHDVAAHVIDADDGHEVTRYHATAEASAVAIDATGTHVAVGDESGAITLFDARQGAGEPPWHPSTRAVTSLGFERTGLVALTTDGFVRSLDPADGRTLAALEVGYTPARLAAGPNGAVAVGLPSGRVVLVDPARGAVLRTLDWSRAQIHALAWAGAQVTTGDAAGRVALWNIGG